MCGPNDLKHNGDEIGIHFQISWSSKQTNCSISMRTFSRDKPKRTVFHRNKIGTFKKVEVVVFLLHMHQKFSACLVLRSFTCAVAATCNYRNICIGKKWFLITFMSFKEVATSLRNWTTLVRCNSFKLLNELCWWTNCELWGI